MSNEIFSNSLCIALTKNEAPRHPPAHSREIRPSFPLIMAGDSEHNDAIVYCLFLFIQAKFEFTVPAIS